MVDRRDLETEPRDGDVAAGREAGEPESGRGAEAAVDSAGAEDAVGGEAGTEIAEAAELELLQREIQQLNDRHLRLAAEFDNYRKRVDRERSESRVRSQAEIVTRILDGLDDLERVISVDPTTTSAAALVEGIHLVERKIRQGLQSAGLEPVDAEGQVFDPSCMEAVMTVPAEHPEEDDIVADVFQKGYRLNGVLVRPAKVRVKKYE